MTLRRLWARVARRLPRRSRPVVLCAVARNEAPYIEEWAAFHLAIGFDRIILYDNDSTDGTAAVFRRGRWPKRVSVVPWPTRPPDPPQQAAYRHCHATLARGAAWLAFLDIDEFLNLRRHASVHAFLADAGRAAAVGINWRMFGSDGRTEAEPTFVIDRFRKAAPLDFVAHRHIKTINRPGTIDLVHVHSSQFRADARLVAADGTPLDITPNALQTHVAFDVAQINHYFTKSAGEFMVKRARGRADLPTDDSERFRAADTFAAYDRNEEEDTSILRWRPALLAQLARMTGAG